MSELRQESGRHRQGGGITARRVLGLGSAVAAAAGVALIVGSSGTANATPDASVTLCHATASVTNPYVEKTVPANAIQNRIFGPNGHGGHTGPIFDPNGGKGQPAWGDIIPPFTYVH